jgi:hypothetical protein
MYIVSSTGDWGTTYIMMTWDDTWSWTCIKQDAYVFVDKALAVTVVALMRNPHERVQIEDVEKD